MRLARYFGGDARSWLNLQAAYGCDVAEISSARRIAREGFWPAAAQAVEDVRREKRVLYSNRLRDCRQIRVER